MTAPAADAASVYWAYEFRGNVLEFEAAPGEQNNVTITQGPDEAILTDTGGTLDDRGLPAPSPGDCDDRVCTVPCHIESPHVARCDRWDGFSSRPPLDVDTYAAFGMSRVDLGDGDDKLTIPPASLRHYVVPSADDGGDVLTLSNSIVDLVAETGTTVSLHGESGGLVTVGGTGAVVSTVDAGQEWIDCAGSGLAPRIVSDPSDSVSGC